MHRGLPNQILFIKSIQANILSVLTEIPYREVQVFYREIFVEGNSNYRLWQYTGFEESNIIEIQGNICILYRNIAIDIYIHVYVLITGISLLFEKQ